MTKVVSGGKRMVWIDWMKAIGIYLVVLGHFFSVGEKFIYVFHVPLFFLISGFVLISSRAFRMEPVTCGVMAAEKTLLSA